MHALLRSVPVTWQQATADPHLCRSLLDTHRQFWVNLLWSHCSFLLGPGAHKVLFVPTKSLFPRLCKFWHLYGGVNDDLLQEGLCHTQVSCTQSPCRYSSPLMTCTSTGDTQAQFCLSLCGVSCILFRNVLYHFEEIPFYSLLVDIFFLFFNQERVFNLVK